MGARTPGALLHIGAEIDAALAGDFNRWCEGQVTASLALPGFVSARRYRRLASATGVGEHPTWLTLYRLEDAGALESDACARHDATIPERFADHASSRRTVYQQIGVHAGASAGADARAILHVTVAVDPAATDSFLDWYAGVHVPAVLDVPGMVRARRYTHVDLDAGGRLPAGAHGYCTIYEMESAAVMGHPEMPAASRRGACPAALEPRRVAWNQVYEEIFRAPGVRPRRIVGA